MKLKNIMLVVENIEISMNFYKELFGLQVLKNFGCNVMMTEGLVLQERKSWEELTEKETFYGGGEMALYFVENNLDGFVERLEQSRFEISYVQEGIMTEGNRKVLRMYDPDNHIIEIGEYL